MWYKFPRQHIGYRRTESDADPLGVLDRFESAREVDVVIAIAAGAMGADGLTAPAGSLADLFEETSTHDPWSREGRRGCTILYIGTEP